MKKIIMLIMALMLTLSMVSLVSADEICDDCGGEDASSPVLDISECIVRVNDRKVSSDSTVLKAFDRGDSLDVRVEFTSSQDAEEVQVMAFLTGYRRGHRTREQVIDVTPTFDIEQNVAYEETLDLRLPEDFEFDAGDELKLRIVISDRFSSMYVREYNLKVDAVRDSVVIQDIILDPYSAVEAGRGLFTSVRVENFGENQEEDVRISVSVPALGLRAVEYIDELDEDEATTSEDMFLRIPVCAEAGVYVLRASVDYADGDEVATKETTIEVLENPECEYGNNGNNNGGNSQNDRTVVTVPGRQDVLVGSTGTVYPVIIQNNGANDRSYELSVAGLSSWGESRFDPGSFLLVKSGEMETVFLHVTANEDAPEGEKIFMVNVETAGDQKQIALTANIVGTEKPATTDLADLRDGLQIGLVVLIVLLIILGLIIAFNKLKGDDDDNDDMSGQTYY